MDSRTRAPLDLGSVDVRTVACEFLGTLLLVFLAVGAAVIGGQFIGTVGISLAFGFTLLVLAYVFGPVSGAHLNPAVTLGMLVARRITVRTAVEYWVAQIVGGIIGAALLLMVVRQVPGLTVHGRFGTNGYGYRSAVGVNIFGAFVVELILTFLLVYVYLAVTRRVALIGFGALAVGLALAVINLMGIPITGAGVNPARSLSPAIFAGSPPLIQVWLFLVAPLVGGALAAVVHEVTHPALDALRAAHAAGGEDVDPAGGLDLDDGR
ncbi:MIP/aquaporin family protein [Actinacidiphila yeochonensis]|uniref:MIP/aquaporin family protein n=1 Tax=Actinacidiphila yeochonensis TaxID=89050 RepID=UPI0006920DE2|nr:aquaporin [Actinacidiphila yeochonensis]